MMDRCETFTDCRTTIPLSFLKVSHLYTIPCSFYESPNEQNRMCELCTFSQIRSHLITTLLHCHNFLQQFINFVALLIPRFCFLDLLLLSDVHVQLPKGCVLLPVGCNPLPDGCISPISVFTCVLLLEVWFGTGL